VTKIGKHLILAALVGLGLRLFFVWHFPAFDDDTAMYEELARNWIDHHVYGLLRRVGAAAGWAVSLLTGVWFAALAFLIALLVFIRNRAIRKEFGAAEVPAISAGAPTSC